MTILQEITHPFRDNALRCLLAVICCLLLVACGEDGTVGRGSASLHYAATPNGHLEGATEQQVESGNSGHEVKAVPAEGYHFTGWSDGLTTPERVDDSLKGDLQVTASFAINQYSLTYTATEHGSIEGPAIQSIEHGHDGREVTAVPEIGYRFKHWSDGVDTASRSDKKVTSPLEVSARFAKANYRLEFVAGENGTISGQISQVVAHGEDATTVVAIPAEHYHFVGWSDGVPTPERTDRNLTGSLHVTANFATESFPLNYLAGQEGTISGPAEQLVISGGSGNEVTAVPADGYHFVGWSDGVITASRVDKDVTSSLSVTADFAINSYSLNYQTGEHGSIKGSLEQQVVHGADGTPVEAVAEPKYRFVRWSDGVATARRADSGIAGPLQVRAEFELATYAVGGSLQGLVNGTEVQLRNGTEETLNLTKNGAFRFATELPVGSRYQIKVVEQPSFPTQTCLVISGSGDVTAKDVTDVNVTCSLNSYAIGGRLIGLPEGDQVVLSNNDRDEVLLKTDGPFSFSQPLDDGSEYLIKVVSQPARENWICELTNASGKLVGTSVSDLLVDCYQQLLLQVTPRRRKAEIAWNAKDFDKAEFNLCLAREEIPEGGFARCDELQDGRVLSKVQAGAQVAELINDTPYWFQLEANYANGRKTLSEAVKVVPFGGLNDTGIDWCADWDKNYHVDSPGPEKEKSCKSLSKTFPGQDGLHGRDAAARARSLSKKGSGAGGFDFVKYCRSGEAAGEKKCPSNPRVGTGYDEWACTLDKVTGLTWEVKTPGGLRASDMSYSWYQPDERINGGDVGKKGDCESKACDTKSYIEQINQMKLCGYNDWRLPTRRELLSIVNNGRFNPAIDTRFFPNTMADYYWTSSPYQDHRRFAWQVYFFYGESKPDEKILARPVRLVRGKTITFGKHNP